MPIQTGPAHAPCHLSDTGVERRRQCHPILRGGEASEKAERGPGENGPTPTHGDCVDEGGAERGVFTFNYGSNRVLTDRRRRRCIEEAASGTHRKKWIAISARSKITSIANVRMSKLTPTSFNACPRRRMGRISDKAFFCLLLLPPSLP